MKSNKNTSSGLSFLEVLQIVFIVLKLCRVIDWGWLWVLVPTWMGIILFLIVFVVVFLVRRCHGKGKKTRAV
jgi:hypothetical protein